MDLQISSSSSKVLYQFVCFLAVLPNIFVVASSRIHVGVLVDNTSRIGIEIRTGSKVAAQGLFYLDYLDPGDGDSLQIAGAAEELIKDKGVEAIVGMTTWEETALVASIGSKAKVPTISFSGSVIGNQNIQNQWPFMLQMIPDLKLQIKCITDIVTSFPWRKVIMIYEVDSHGSDSGAFTMLLEGLQVSSIDIDHRLVLPPYSSLSDPESFIRKEVSGLFPKKSRVFIVLKTSLAWGIPLFNEAREQKLMDKHSAWIVSDPLAGLLDSMGISENSSLEGALGVTSFFSVKNIPFQHFKQQFRRVIREDYPEEEISEPGIYALRAFDSIMAIKEAIKTANGNSTDLLAKLMSSNFTGLSGVISFQDGELLQPSMLKIVNVIGRKYRDLAYWNSDQGFSRIPYDKGGLWENRMSKWSDSILWPGELKEVPKGWSMPTESNPLIIAVPGRTTFEKFVKVWTNSSSPTPIISGYCIDIFYEALRILEKEKNFHLPHKFVPFDGSYTDLVRSVANKTYDAAVGDITILANRSLIVDFTQPYAESGLTMVVKVKSHSQSQAWIFLQPFTAEMWAVTGVMLWYTVLVVWLLERHNPEFSGPWWSQLSTAIWFTFCSLFFVHREKIHNNYTRVVVLAWLCVVLALNSSYTASLSSLLTVPRLTPTVRDMQWLKDQNKSIGCDGDSFVLKYLIDVFGFKPENIRNVTKAQDYPKEFESRNISAAFFEIPYQKAFFSMHCKGYTVVQNNSHFIGDRFGGLGFVFQKGSPITYDMSRAILKLSETGRLKLLELSYFSPSPECSKPDSNYSLDWSSFWGLYLFSAGTSAICYLIYSLHQLLERWRWPHLLILNFSPIKDWMQHNLRQMV